MEFGRLVGDLPRGPLPAEVPRVERLLSVFCGSHPNNKSRCLVAVLTKQGRLLTQDEDRNWLRPGYDTVLVFCAVCDRPQRAALMGPVAPQRVLSVAKLRALSRSDRCNIALQEVLAQEGVAPGTSSS